MCNAWPGTRCSHDMGRRLDTRKKALIKVLEKHAEDSPEAFVAIARLRVAQADYDSTPKGMDELREHIISNPDDADAAKRLAVGELTRKMQQNASQEINNGRFEAVQEIVNDLNGFMDKEEIGSVIESARESRERYALKKAESFKETDQSRKYQDFVKNLRESLETRHPDGIPPKLQGYLNRLSDMKTPDQINMSAYAEMPKSLELSRKALIKEIKNASALQGAPAKVTAEYYEAYREQYKREFAHLPESERPDVPDSWIRGEFEYSGYARAFGSTYAPHDQASMYAMYRLRSDDKAIPDFLKRNAPIASIDLETAGPAGNEGFKPENGHIIEVGVVTYNSKGKEINRLSQLMSAPDEFVAKHGTGAMDIHQIKPEDIKGKPSFQQVAPELIKYMEGKTMLAQNASFEDKWLASKLPGYSEAAFPVIDTYEMAMKHLDLPNNKLETICNAVGVKYYNGHRAEHDAEVTGDSFFALRTKIRKDWNSKPARRDAPALKNLPHTSRWSPKAAPTAQAA